MHSEIAKNLERWRHDHVFGQDQAQAGEKRTRWVIAITATTMVIEIVAGVVYGSMALLADGIHMASHAAALSINAFAYYYARRCAHDSRFSFGTGKVNALGGFSGALLLALFALLMVWESVERFFNPVAIGYNQAILVAIVGLLVNAVSVFILGGHHDHDHHHGHDEHHEHHEQEHARDHGHGHAHGHGHHHDHHHDHNLRSAYLHVLADALTSVLAIFALIAGKFYGLNWLDPAMGIVGAILVARWSAGLLRATARVLLDREAPDAIRDAVRDAVEADGTDVITDLHVWSIGPGIYSAIISLVSAHPRPPDAYRERLPEGLGLVHVSIEVNPSAPDTAQ